MFSLFNKANPGRAGLPFKIIDLRQLDTGEGFKHIKNGGFIHFTISDLLIAMISGLRLNVKGCNRRPITSVIHWLKPTHNIIYVFEFFHALKISRRVFGMQKTNWKGLSA